MPNEEHSTAPAEHQPPSKSQRKRDSQALRALGETLVGLPESRLAQIELPETLREAVDLARRIKAHGGRKRQLQYIGKLLRGMDAAPIQAALEAMRQQDARASRRFHQLEALRERLIEDGDAALGALFESYPQADRQHLRQLIRQAQRDRGADKSRGPRALFRYLRELDEAVASGPDDA
ncbi:ribosome biogenesis factor YjgA [Thiohalobacter sp. IOR34]|uniref:ribosome biogenesis factor YjgA n=1 Tax=Thiohalobacter sp. IOR34 TaxID=3057176 RepID=UPI0025B1869D|nr:ribosome biogenesis factor YjgA [Thiohalobacter sp. IOR34]WJW74870.1 ribosome biogenesis factor YjgA [Thiohalobacter sp. IOR34]